MLSKVEFFLTDFANKANNEIIFNYDGIRLTKDEFLVLKNTITLEIIKNNYRDVLFTNLKELFVAICIMVENQYAFDLKEDSLKLSSSINSDLLLQNIQKLSEKVPFEKFFSSNSVIDTQDFSSFLSSFVPGEKIEIINDSVETETRIKYPRPELSNNFVKAETELDQKIVEIWEDVLNISSIGLDDPFFDLGGNSLLALQIISKINFLNLKKMSIVTLFQYSTIRNLSKYLDENQEQIQKIELKPRKNKSSDIAIIAMTGRFPNANSIDELWKNIKLEENSIEIFPKEKIHSSVSTEERLNPNFVPATGLYEGFDTFDCQYFGFTPKEASILEPQHRKLLELSVELLEFAGVDSYKTNKKIGIFAGMANTTYIHNIYKHKNIVEQFGDLAISFANEKDYLVTRVAHKLNLKGPALSIHTACSTSLVTIIEAVKSIRNGDCEIAIAGGISINSQPYKGHLFQEGGILSKDGKCKPFDNSATGTVFNDGAGLVLLKSLEDAISDGDHIYGVIKGVAINNDGADKISYSAPSVFGQADVIANAIQDAGINIEDLSYLEAHGTGTPVGDPVEIEGLNKAFKYFSEKDSFCYLGSVKSNIGHLTCAAGVAGLFKAIKVLEDKYVPKMANYNELNNNIDLEKTPFLINNSPVSLPEQSKYYAGISSFGVGGTNAHMIIESYENQALVSNSKEYLFTLSAKTNDQLKEYEEKLLHELKKLKPNHWAAASYNLNTGRVSHKYRSSFVLSNNLEIKPSKYKVTNKTFDKKEIFLMFPGQGSQYIGMGKSLYNEYAIFKETFDYCCTVLKPLLGCDLKEIIFSENDESAYDALKNTFYTQPALFALEYSYAVLLLDRKIEISGLVGHSIGEFVSATLSGVFSAEIALTLIAKRAQLMSNLPSGSMLSVSLSTVELHEYLNPDIQLASSNSENLSVVAGPTEKIKALLELFESKNINAKLLHTSHAFHSNMMNPIVSEFQEFVSGFTLNLPVIDMFSTVTGKFEKEIFTKPEYWANHMREPVLFYKTISSLLKDRNPILIEIGPRSTLTVLSHKIAINENLKNQVILNSLGDCPENELVEFKKVLGALWVYGNNIDFDFLYPMEEKKNYPFISYPFKKTKIWLDWIDSNQMSSTNTLFNNNENINMNTEINKGIPMTVSSTDVLRSKIEEIFEEASGINTREYDDETSFIEMGMDSLFLTQISLKLKKELKVEVSFRQLADEFSTIKDLTESLVSKVDRSFLQIPNESIVPVVNEITSHSNQNQTPAYIAPSVHFNSSSNGTIQDIINQQLALMNQQIQLLSGQGISNQQAIAPQEKNSAPNPTHSPVKSSSVKEIKKVDVNNAKTAYGAIARITTYASSSLTEKQKSFIDNFFYDYSNKTKTSKAFTQRNRINHSDPRVVTGFKPEMKEVTYPIVVNKSKGQYLWDLDDNRYIDMTNGFGCNFFGYKNEKITKYVLEQLEAGIETGPQHPLTEDVSLLICELTGNERVGFCNTGSEAVLGAMRIARTVSGNDKIVSFNGSYHGIHDEVIIRGGKNGRPVSAAPGITQESVSNMIVLDYGTDEALKHIREHKEDIAAVLVEPVQSRRCGFQPKEFLLKLRALTTELGICLIFDEVITGFRIKIGGAQEYFGIDADLCCYGKIVGGGMPIGVVAGSSKYMDALDGGYWNYGDDSTPTVGVTYFAGTFVRHPLALAAAKGALEIIKEGGNNMLDQLTNKAQHFCDSINLYAKLIGAPFKFDNFGGLMKPSWTEDLYHGDLFFALMKYKGVHVYDGYPWYYNLAHTDADIKVVVDTIKECLLIMQKEGFIPGLKNENLISEANAPVEGARLGLDENGEPAWYSDNNIKIEKE